MADSSSRDNASAARNCLVVLAIGAALVVIVVALIVGSVVRSGGHHGSATPSPALQASTTGSRPFLFTIMDVGQGLCVVVIAPDGHSLVADGGRSGERMEQHVIPYLRAHGITRVDYVVTTNPDQDHLG